MATSKKPAEKNTRPTNTGVFDIARPGKGQVTSATSRPVMITNRPVIKDDMVNEVPTEEPKTAPLVQPTRKVVITPLHNSPKPEVEPAVESKVNESTPSAVAPEPPKTDESNDSVSISVTRTSKAVPAQTSPVPDDQAAVTDAGGKPVTVLDPTPSAGVPSTKRDDKQLSLDQVEAAAKSAEERAARLEHMIEEEQYFLPINAVQERRSRRIAIAGLLLIILLAAAWYDAALDAGLITNTYNLPHTHLFTVK